VSIGLFAAHVLLAGWSLYRRVFQVLRLDLQVSSVVLSAGGTVSYDVLTTGETRNRIVLELVQGMHAETLVEQQARVSAVSMYDVRLFRNVRSVAITPELLERFTPGSAKLRLTGFGGQKLLRTPRPRVRELAVELRR
jgi:hypothetical protein